MTFSVHLYNTRQNCSTANKKTQFCMVIIIRMDDIGIYA